jgi:hypothetical protein
MIFDLLADFAAASDAMPAAHPSYRQLVLLEKAIRRDAHFIARHHDNYPQALFQCTWNNGRACEQSPADPPDSVSPLRAVLDRWLDRRERTTSGFFWLRSVPAPFQAPDTSLHAALKAFDGAVTNLRFLPGGSRLLSASGTVNEWDLSTLLKTRTWPGHDFALSIDCPDSSQEKYGLVCLCFDSGATPVHSSRLVDGRSRHWLHVVDYESAAHKCTLGPFDVHDLPFDVSADGRRLAVAHEFSA